MGYDVGRQDSLVGYRRISAMIARFVLGSIGLVLAAITVKRMIEELRRSTVRVSNEDGSVAPRAVTQLKQDPKTGIYYPAE
jgi:hypothetical protein